MKRLATGLLAAALAVSCIAGCIGGRDIGNERETAAPLITIEPTQAILPTDAILPTAAPKRLSENENEAALSNFTLDVTLLADENKLSVEQKIDYKNPAAGKLAEVYFNLYPNAFGSDGGGVKVKSIKLNGGASELEQVKGTVYKVAFANPLEAGARCKIEISYDVLIPNIKNRFGYQENIFNLGNFIITPAVYESTGFAVEPYVDIGDAFYTDIANYNVGIKVPNGFKVAATGELGADGRYHAKNVRDFAFCASANFETIAAEAGNTAVTVYYDAALPKTAKRVLDIASKAVLLYDEKFGEYPYRTLNVVLNGLTGGVSGMEYPTLIMVAPEISVDEFEAMGLDFNTDESAAITLYSMDRSVCHEVAHQWFYGIVGNDQIKAAWLDEGFCRFCEFVYDEAYPPDFAVDISAYAVERSLKTNVACVAGIGRDPNTSYAEDTTDLTKSLYDWEDTDPMGYSDVYDKGAGLFYAMYLKMGSTAFFEAAQGYVMKFKYGFVTNESFVEYWLSMADVHDIIEAYLSVPQ